MGKSGLPYFQNKGCQYSKDFIAVRQEVNNFESSVVVQELYGR